MSGSDKGGVYRLTPDEIEALRAEMKASGQWMKRQLEIDPELRHLDDGHQSLSGSTRQAPTRDKAIQEDDGLDKPEKDQERPVPAHDQMEKMIMEAGDAALRKLNKRESG